MKLRAILAAGLFVAIAGNVQAQQDPQFTQFYFNKLMINPATAGYHDNICVNLFNRFQWTGFDGAPFTNQLSVDANLKTFVGLDMGVGLTVFNDNIGFFNTTGLRVAGAYRIPLGNNGGRLGIGLDLGFMNMMVNPKQWIGPQTSDPNIDTYIPPKGSAMVFDAGLGVFYHTQNWYAGISAKQLPGMRFKSLNYRSARHMFFMGGYTFRGVTRSLDINPNAIVKTDLATVSFDVNVNFIINQRYWAGLTYRFQDAVALNLGMILWQNDKNAFTAGYSYDLTTSRLLKFSYGTHELMLKYCLKLAKPDPQPGVRVRDLGSKKNW